MQKKIDKDMNLKHLSSGVALASSRKTDTNCLDVEGVGEVDRSWKRGVRFFWIQGMFQSV